MLTMSIRLHNPLAARAVRIYFRNSKLMPANRQRLRFSPCIVRACHTQPDCNSKQRSDTCEPPLRKSVTTSKEAPRTNFRRTVKSALAWAVLFPLAFSILPGLASAQAKRNALPVSAITTSSTTQPTASTCAKMTHIQHISTPCQGVFASISISSFGHMLRHLHTAHIAQLLTYQAQRVSFTISLSNSA